VFELVSSLGGAVSGEHGDGRLRTAYIRRQYGALYPLFLQAKSLMDAEGLFNPDIKTVADDEQMMKYLRFGSDYGSREFPGKQLVWNEGFTDEAEKCHGCSKCTTVTTATRMCPVFKATRDETAAPKAKANILRALVSGAIDDESLYETAFQEVINCCVNCGSCVVECPSNVNIPKLAIEAKAQYVKRYGAGLENKVLANCDKLGRYTHKLSPLIAKTMKLKLNRKVMELMTGVTAERPFVAFNGHSLFERMKKRSYKQGGDLKVLYFAGCYASYINPDIGEASIEILEKLGCDVTFPEQYCCGIPFLSKGMTDDAKDRITKNLEAWGRQAEEADYVVVSCSSCGLSLLKEWQYLMSDELIDKISAKLIHITSLVNMRKGRLKLKESKLKLAYHKSCHMKVQKDNGASVAMLESLPGVTVTDLNSSCCGMAGSWGMKAENVKLSKEIGSPMLKRLNDSQADYGVTDCPTCAIQMQHCGNKPVRHPVEVLKECLED
jgi:Fe-S oxidoreductase